MHAVDQTPENESGAVADAWRKALWILEALPPSRPAETGNGGVQRRRKLAANLRAVVRSSGEAGAALNGHVVGNVPFLLGLMWWATNRHVEDEVLNNWNLLQTAAGRTLVTATGSPRAAYAALADYARARATDRDDAFTEARLLAQVVRSLQVARAAS